MADFIVQTIASKQVVKALESYSYKHLSLKIHVCHSINLVNNARYLPANLTTGKFLYKMKVDFSLILTHQ